MGYNGIAPRKRVSMETGRAPQKGPGDEHRPARPQGQIVPFPERRSFGPLSWRVVRLASLVVLVLILIGAVVEVFFGHYLREAVERPSKAAQAVP